MLDLLMSPAEISMWGFIHIATTDSTSKNSTRNHFPHTQQSHFFSEIQYKVLHTLFVTWALKFSFCWLEDR